MLWLGTNRTLCNGVPLMPFDLGPYGAPGCALLAEPLVVVANVAGVNGIASVPFSVPQFPSTVEVTVFVQGAVVAPAANALGFVFSRGLALKIQ